MIRVLEKYCCNGSLVLFLLLTNKTTPTANRIIIVIMMSKAIAEMAKIETADVSRWKKTKETERNMYGVK